MSVVAHTITYQAHPVKKKAEEDILQLELEPWLSPIQTHKRCFALNKTYDRCTAVAKYRSNMIINRHIHTPLCKKHSVELNNTRKLGKGLMFDSDLYMKKIVNRKQCKQRSKLFQQDDFTV